MYGTRQGKGGKPEPQCKLPSGLSRQKKEGKKQEEKAKGGTLGRQ